MSHTPGGRIVKGFLNAVRTIAVAAGPTYPLVEFMDEGVPDPPSTLLGVDNVILARTNFEALLGTPSPAVEDFEAYIVPTPLLDDSFTLNGITMSIPNPNPGLYNPVNMGVVRGAPFLGRFNTTSGGSKFVNSLSSVADDSTGDQLAFDFSPPIAFFGAYFTDIADFGGEVSVRLTASDASTHTTVLTLGDSIDGGMMFYGFADKEKTYTKIEFFSSVGFTNLWGIDDVTFGPVSMLA